MKNFLNLFSAVCLAALIFTGCQDKDYFEPPTDPVDNVEPSLLDFSTTQDVLLNITYADAPKGLITVFDVYMENPLVKETNGEYALKSGLEPIAGGIIVGSELKINKTLPASAKELYVYSPDLFVPMLLSAEIKGGMANFEVVDLSVPAVEESDTRTIGANTIDGYLGKGNNNTTIVGSSMDINNNTYKPNYIFENKPIAAKYLNRIKSAFPNKKAVTNPNYFRDAILYLYEEAEIKLALIHGDASNDNTLSYFFYTGTPGDISTVNKNTVKEIVAIPYAKLDKNNGLKAGDMVQLMYYDDATQGYVKKFPRNTTIGFLLRADAFVAPTILNWWTPSINRNKDVFYSALAWNSDNFQHTIYFNAAIQGEQESFVCFGFEDQKGGGDKDCNDLMFHVDIHPGTAIEEPPHIPEAGQITHSENRKGVLAFEDNWPFKGDYDLNDVVVNYTSETTYVQETKDGEPIGPIIISNLDDKITLAHSGANYRNAFAYKINMAPSLVDRITIDNADYAPVADGNGFIVKISDDIHADLNTVKLSDTEYSCTPKTFSVQVFFKEDNGTTQTDFNNNKLNAPYNPYITTPNAGAEVHLPHYPPTSNADVNLFGTGDDRSVPGQLWYVGPSNTPYPFAVHLYNQDGFLKIPVETKSIDYTYPKYTNWVNSLFTEDLDWFEHPQM